MYQVQNDWVVAMQICENETLIVQSLVISDWYSDFRYFSSLSMTFKVCQEGFHETLWPSPSPCTLWTSPPFHSDLPCCILHSQWRCSNNSFISYLFFNNYFALINIYVLQKLEHSSMCNCSAGVFHTMVTGYLNFPRSINCRYQDKENSTHFLYRNTYLNHFY